MTSKEKLIDLLTDNLEGCDNPLQMCMDEQVEKIAEHLLDEGVLVSHMTKDTQWLDLMTHPLEPVKVAAALQSELMKYDHRLCTNPSSISPLDLTIIACLRKYLDETEERKPNDAV